MQQKLMIRSDRMAADDVQAMTRDVVRDINRNSEARAELAAGEIRPGERGDAVAIGAVVLSFISSGAAVALLQVVRSYFERDESLEMAFERADGQKMTIKAANMHPERISQTVAAAREFFAADARATG